MNTLNITLPGADQYFTIEAFNVLRTNLQFSGQDKKVILLTSVHENEGKSTTSLHLAVSFAELGKNILFIDADMRKSAIASRNTDAQVTSGLSEVLTGQQNLQDCIWKTQYPSLHVLFSGAFPPNPVELLDGKYFAKLIDAARNVYDYVIIDTPPVGAVIDAAVIATQCDGALLLVAGDRVHSRPIIECCSQIEKSGCHLLGIVRNFIGGKSHAYTHKKSGYGETVKAEKTNN